MSTIPFRFSVFLVLAIALALTATGYLTSPSTSEAQNQPISNVSHIANPAKAVVTWSNSGTDPVQVDWLYTDVEQENVFGLPYEEAEIEYVPFEEVTGSSVTFTKRPHAHGGGIAGETISLRLSTSDGLGGKTPFVEYSFTVPSQVLPPLDLATDQDGGDLLVTWTPAYPDLPAEEHAIRWRETEGDATWQERVIPAATSHRISNPDGTRHEVEVANVYDRARDIISPFAYARPEIVSSLSSELRDVTAISLHWNSPSEIEGARFLIQAHVDGEDLPPIYEGAEDVVPGSWEYSHDLDLEHNSKYVLSVRHVTFDDAGHIREISDVSSVNQQTSVFPHTNLTATPVRSQIALRWDTDPRNGNINDYGTTVRYRKPGQTQWNYSEVLPAGDNITGLKPGRYEVEVLNHAAGVPAQNYFYQHWLPVAGEGELSVDNFSVTVSGSDASATWEQKSYAGQAPVLLSIRHRDYTDPNSPGGWMPNAHGAILGDDAESASISGLRGGSTYQTELLYTHALNGKVKTYVAAKETIQTPGVRDSKPAVVEPTVLSTDTSIEAINILGIGKTDLEGGVSTYDIEVSEEAGDEVIDFTIIMSSRPQSIKDVEAPTTIRSHIVQKSQRLSEDAVNNQLFSMHAPFGETTPFTFTVVAQSPLHEQKYTINLIRPERTEPLLPGAPIYPYAADEHRSLYAEWSPNPDGADPTGYKLRYKAAQGIYHGIDGVDSFYTSWKTLIQWDLNPPGSEWVEIDLPAQTMRRRHAFTIYNNNGEEAHATHPWGTSYLLHIPDTIHIEVDHNNGTVVPGYILEVAAYNNHGQSEWVQVQDGVMRDLRGEIVNGVRTWHRPPNHQDVMQTPIWNHLEMVTIELSDGEIYPPFDGHPHRRNDRIHFVATVGAHVDEIAITGETSDIDGLVVVWHKGEDHFVKHHEHSTTPKTLPLAVGKNVLQVQAEDQNGNRGRVYTVTITREGSAISELSNITPSHGELIPAFTPGNQNYILYLAEYQRERSP